MPNTKSFTRVLDAEHVIGESNRLMSREQILLNITTVRLVPGLVLGKQTEGAITVTSAAVAGNTGNGTLTGLTADATTNAGTYRVEFYSPTKFNLIDSRGVIVTKGTVGVAVDSDVNFTINAGGTAFVAGDAFTIPVTVALANAWGPLDPTATNGLEIPKGVLFAGRPISTVTQRGVAHVRDCRLNGKKLTWPTGFNQTQINAAIAQLMARGQDGYGGVQIGY